MKVKLLITGLLSLCLISGGCSPSSDFNDRLNSITESYRFNIVAWEARAFQHEVHQVIYSERESISDSVAIVIEYFSVTGEQKRNLQDKAERILENQIEEALIGEDIFGFPPVNLKLDTMPYLLVISPRHKITSTREILLQKDLNIKEMELIESKVDRLDVSSLVVELGGYGGVYPSLVANDARLRVTIEAATEEWLHQYLAFKPLGYCYVLDLLGIAPNYDIATMNETVAGMISEEIASIICERYYPKQNDKLEPEFFNREMREIRKQVDAFLARGEVEQAEEFMKQKRQYLASKGHYIRKLNQAYFAWHSTYANKATSISPIGVELRELRKRSVALKDFLSVVEEMTSHQDLLDRIK